MFKGNDKRQIWVPCPRCINGNMYKESSGEYVCLQCGYHRVSEPVAVAENYRFLQTNQIG